MYTCEDRDGTSLTLRPEATASVMRAYIEHRLDQIPGVKKFYYIGPMFRRERPQKGRYRQFFQIGAEAIGSESPIVDAEVIEMVVEILRRVRPRRISPDDQFGRLRRMPPGIHGRAAAKNLSDVRSTLCADCQRRAVTNPLRVLDCKVPDDQPIIDTLPSILDHLCDECHAHFNAVQDHLHDRGIAYEVRPRMVRGLDYYMRTTFEITHGSLGAQNSVLGGGRYDGLAESLGSRVPAPGIGFSIGEDRLVMSVEEAHPPGKASTCSCVPLGGVAEEHAGRAGRRIAGRRHLRRALGRPQAQARARSRQQDGRALRADSRRQTKSRPGPTGEKYGAGRAVAAPPRSTCRTHSKTCHPYLLIFWATCAAPISAASCAPPMPARKPCSWAGCIAAAIWAASSSSTCATAKASRNWSSHADADPAVHAKAELLRLRIRHRGRRRVALRTADTINPAIPTGEVELVVEKLWILNESRTPPFPMEDDVDVKEDARLKYRYVDLRRPHMQRNIILRSKIAHRRAPDADRSGFSRNRNARS